MLADRLEAQTVDVTVDNTGKLWLNVDGVCLVRIGKVHNVTIDDPLRGRADIEFNASPKHAS